MGQANTTTAKNKPKIERIINENYDEKQQKLNLCKLNIHLDRCGNDWRRVLEFRNWTALRTLYLGNTTTTQGNVTHPTLELN